MKVMNGIQYYVKSNYFFMQRHKYLDLNTTLSLPQQEQYKLRNQFFFEFSCDPNNYSLYTNITSAKPYC